MQTYDILVIGAGSGGLVAALEANRRGAKVAMLEKNKIGGECTHSGCVPSKALINVAKHYSAMVEAPSLGLPAVDVAGQFDFASAMEHVASIVDGVYAHEQPEAFQKVGIDTYIHPSGAQFLDEHTVQIGDDVLKAKHMVICTGSSPRLLPTMGDEPVEFLTNENFWDLRTQPKSIAFLGGGVISAELGQSLARFGSEVTIIDRNPRILKVVDDDIAAYAIDVLQENGIKMVTEADVEVCSVKENGQVCLHIKQGKDDIQRARTLDVDRLFVAIGRVPNTGGMALEKAGVAYARHGITVNEYLQTSVPHIYAVGDVAERAKFTHVAAYQAEIAVKNILYGNELKNDLSVLPWAIFTEPEIGHVGLTEAQAREKFDAGKLNGVQVFQVDAAVDRFITDSKVGGLLKVVMDSDNRILGGTGVGAHAGEWIQLLTVAIHASMQAEDIANIIFAYPTYSELVKKAFTRFLRTKLVTNS